MIRLNNVNRKLQIVLAVAITTNQLAVVLSYSDKATGYVGATQLSNSNSTTAVDICAAPAASTIRDIDYINVRNNDTATATVTIRYNDSGTLYSIIIVALLPGEAMTFTHSAGWCVFNSSGAIKNVYAATTIELSTLTQSGATNGQAIVFNTGTGLWAPATVVTYATVVSALGFTPISRGKIINEARNSAMN